MILDSGLLFLGHPVGVGQKKYKLQSRSDFYFGFTIFNSRIGAIRSYYL